MNRKAVISHKGNFREKLHYASVAEIALPNKRSKTGNSFAIQTLVLFSIKITGFY